MHKMMDVGRACRHFWHNLVLRVQIPPGLLDQVLQLWRRHFPDGMAAFAAAFMKIAWAQKNIPTKSRELLEKMLTDFTANLHNEASWKIVQDQRFWVIVIEMRSTIQHFAFSMLHIYASGPNAQVWWPHGKSGVDHLLLVSVSSRPRSASRKRPPWGHGDGRRATFTSIMTGWRVACVIVCFCYPGRFSWELHALWTTLSKEMQG